MSSEGMLGNMTDQVIGSLPTTQRNEKLVIDKNIHEYSSPTSHRTTQD
jgi:hypothetical protein